MHLVIQPKGTGTGGMHQQVHLDFDPTAGIHEYRIDYLPGRVVFYADSRPLAAMEGDGVVPLVGGHLILQHWSNGDPQWSGGPPGEDALLAVRYVQAYFNSSGPDDGRGKSARRCGDHQSCVIQDVEEGQAREGDLEMTLVDDAEDGAGARRGRKVALVLGVVIMAMYLFRSYPS